MNFCQRVLSEIKYVVVRDESELLWDRVIVHSLRMQSAQNACAVKKKVLKRSGK